MLNTQSTLFARDKLDDPEKLDALRRRAQNVLAGTARTPGSNKLAPVEAGVHD
jgi:hypothetical protein